VQQLVQDHFLEVYLALVLPGLELLLALDQGMEAQLQQLVPVHFLEANLALVFQDPKLLRALVQLAAIVDQLLGQDHLHLVMDPVLLALKLLPGLALLVVMEEVSHQLEPRPSVALVAQTHLLVPALLHSELMMDTTSGKSTCNHIIIRA